MNWKKYDYNQMSRDIDVVNKDRVASINYISAGDACNLLSNAVSVSSTAADCGKGISTTISNGFGSIRDLDLLKTRVEILEQKIKEALPDNVGMKFVPMRGDF